MFDIELTNRCNADCGFCPRSETPHEGLMDEATFAMALQRVLDHREFTIARTGEFGHGVSFCGLGDVLVHPDAANRVARVRDEDLRCQINTNAGNLSPSVGRDLVEAGLQNVHLNAGAMGDDYEQIYGIPYQRTHDNIVEFIETARGRCSITMVLVVEPGREERADETERYWRARGIEDFRRPTYINRGGALSGFGEGFLSPRAQREARRLLAVEPEPPRCATPFVWLFIGYDGKYYLCSSDWRKESAHGDVASTSIADAMRSRLTTVRERGSPCRTCNIDPRNQVAEHLARGDNAAAEETAALMEQQWTAVTASLSRLGITTEPESHGAPT